MPLYWPTLEVQSELRYLLSVCPYSGPRVGANSSLAVLKLKVRQMEAIWKVYIDCPCCLMHLQNPLQKKHQIIECLSKVSYGPLSTKLYQFVCIQFVSVSAYEILHTRDGLWDTDLREASSLDCSMSIKMVGILQGSRAADGTMKRASGVPTAEYLSYLPD